MMNEAWLMMLMSLALGRRQQTPCAGTKATTALFNAALFGLLPLLAELPLLCVAISTVSRPLIGVLVAAVSLLYIAFTISMTEVLSHAGMPLPHFVLTHPACFTLLRPVPAQRFRMTTDQTFRRRVLLLSQGMTASKRRVKHFDNTVSAITADALINAEAIAIYTAQAAVSQCSACCCGRLKRIVHGVAWCLVVLSERLYAAAVLRVQRRSIWCPGG